MSRPAVAVVADPPAPETVFARLAHLPYALWLDSAADTAGTGRWSFIATSPFALLHARNGRTIWTTPEGAHPIDEPPMAALTAALESMRTAGPAPFPFDGGAAGFIAYEAASAFERLPPRLPVEHALPDVHLAFYDVVTGWDRQTGACHVVSTGRPLAGTAADRRARERLAETLDWLTGGGPAAADGIAAAVEPAPTERVESVAVPDRAVEGQPWLRSTVTRAEYATAVERIVEAIREGEVYQVNLSQRFAARTAATPGDIHRELRRRSPAPYGAVVRAGEGTIISSSPERFLRVDRAGRVETRPIKGTRPRGLDPQADAALATQLRASEKDRAENLMIVDLMRNDLSRICSPGSIRVPELYRLESWSTVHHLVSVVRGLLRDDVDVAQLLRATFPCGSVTGAPKIRAMEMIAHHERVARGPYCGAIGYFGFGGDIDLSVAIRILVAETGRVLFHAGGGIVYDSDPDDEYRETLAKVRAIIDTLEAVGEERP